MACGATSSHPSEPRSSAARNNTAGERLGAAAVVPIVDGGVKVKTSNSIPFGDSADHVEADGGEATAAVAPWSGFDVTPAAVYVVVATLVSQARKLLDGTNRR
jgi:hypothetical protein